MYTSINNATGTEVIKIKNDITLIVNELDEVHTKIKDKKEQTNNNADSCQRCYNNWYNDNRHEKVGINSDNGHPFGYITVNDEEKYVEASLDEMFNS